MRDDDKLIFVYNAESNIFSTVSNYVHKIISPETYACSLCKLTYTNFGIKAEWKSFLDNLQIQKEFLHLNQYIKKYGRINASFPVIFLQANGTLNVLTSAKEIDACLTLNDLKNLLQVKLAVYD